jgi:phosphotriesterase-related protein
MVSIPTVTGSVDSSELGFTLVHEHIATQTWQMRVNVNGWFDRDAVKAKAVDYAKKAISNGVKTLIDLTPLNIGRDVHLMQEVAEESGIQIVCATGLYFHFEPWMWGHTNEQIADLLMRDVEVGIADTTIKPGIIKCATHTDGLDDDNLRSARVAALTHLRSGLPISTHTNAAARNGLIQLDVFEEAGVDLGKVVIGHSDTTDLDYLRQLLGRGCFVGIDRFGSPFGGMTHDERAEVVATLAKEGYANRIALSHDAPTFCDWFDKDLFDSWTVDWNWSYLPTQGLAALRAKGVSEADIQQMTVGTPRAIFEASG